MIRGVIKRPIKRNRLAKAFAGPPDIVYKVSEGFHHKLTRLSASSMMEFSMMIQNKLALMYTARQRNKTITGRWINRLMFEDSRYVELNGVELTTLMQMADETTDIAIDYSSKQLYAVPYDEVETMYGRLKEHVQTQVSPDGVA